MSVISTIKTKHCCCNICGKSFSRPSFLHRHEVVHTKLKPFKCVTCKRGFCQKSSLQRHIATKHTQEISNSNKEDLDKLAAQVVDSLKQLQHGIQCNAPQFTRPALSTRTNTKIIPTKKIIVYQDCQVVDRLQPDGTANIINTLSTCHGGKFFYACEFCNKEFQKSYDLIRHRRSHTKEAPYGCNYCIKKFKTADRLKSHKQLHNLDAETGLINHMHKCTLCEIQYRSQSLLKDHFKSEHSDAAYSAESNQERNVDRELEMLVPLLPEPISQTTVLTSHSSQRQYKCVYCATVFRRKYNCRCHMRNHLKQLLNEGVDTDATASTVSTDYLVVRKTSCDFELLPVYHKTCPQCSKTFRKLSDLQRHHLSVHTNLKPFSCAECKKSFALKLTLLRHMRTHAPISLRDTFLCRVCGKKYGSDAALQLHLRVHTFAKPFKCEFCAQTFRTSGHRLAHMQAGRHKQKFNFN